MSSPDKLFLGVPRGSERGFSARLISQIGPARVVVPFAGSFALASTAAQVLGTKRILASDVSLYSHVIGRAITGEDYRLALRDDGELQSIVAPLIAGGPVDKATAVLYVLRVCQFDRKDQNLHLRSKQELLRRSGVYLADIRAQVVALAQALAGIDYQTRGPWDVLGEWADNDGAFLLLDPPRYDGAHDRMFAGAGLFDWDAPDAAAFGEDDIPALVQYLADAKARALLWFVCGARDPSEDWPDPWRAAFADRVSSSRSSAYHWIMTNQPDSAASIMRTKSDDRPRRFRLFSGEVKAESRLWAVAADRATADYYRDLFIHKLPGSMSTNYALLFLDGMLFAVVGLIGTDFRRGDTDYIFVHFNFTVPAVHKRLHKLTLLSVSSAWFYRDIFGSAPWFQVRGLPAAVKTLMLTKHPNSMAERGIFKMATRETLPGGGYKLYYSADLRHENRKETLQTWLNKWGK